MPFCQSCGQALLVPSYRWRNRSKELWVSGQRQDSNADITLMAERVHWPWSFLAQGTVEAHISQNSWQWAVIPVAGCWPKKCVWSAVNHVQGWTLETFHETSSPLLTFCSDTECCKSEIEKPGSLSHHMEEKWPGGVSKYHWILYNRDIIFYLVCWLRFLL